MASKASRWANSEEDAALEAKLKQEKEEKKRIKAEKARKAEAERQSQEAAAAAAAVAASAKAAQQAAEEEDQRQDGAHEQPPAKRRRVSPHPETASTPADGAVAADGADKRPAQLQLLRFPSGGFGHSRSVENFDKLNDIEEGAYGWVARAREQATGKVVALKRLKLDPKDRSGLPITGLREIQILKDCDHRNVVKLQEVVVGDDTSKIEK